MRYQVEFELDGKREFEELEDCKDAGMAFARCQKKYPGATMIHCIAYGRRNDEGCMHHDPPPVQRDYVREPRPARPPKPNEKDGTMPFYDEVRRTPF